MSSTTVTVRPEPTPLEQQPEWLDNGVDHSKSSVHQNNVEQNRGANDPVLPVLSSVAASAASAHCSPSHWDSAASVCLMCDGSTYLWEGKCLSSCPASTLATNRTDLSGQCVPCHYSCLSCSGPSDSECTVCHADSQLHSVTNPGSKSKPEFYCHPRDLMNQLTGYERWALGIELALAFNVAIVVALVAYLCCSRSSGSSCFGTKKDTERGDYRHLISYNPHSKSPNNLNIEYSGQGRASISDEDDD